MITQLLAAAALLATPATTPAPAACITKAQAGDVAVVLLAHSVPVLTRMCAPHLPETAFLRNADGAAYMQRLRIASDARRANALAGLNRVMPGGDAEAMLSEFTDPPGSADKQLPMAQAICAEMNRMFEALSPLPPENVATVVSAFGGMAVAVGPLVDSAMAEQRRGRGRARNAPRQMPNPFAFFCPA